MRGYWLAAAGLLAIGTAACREKTPANVMSRHRFVMANVALRSVADTVANGDSLRAAAMKRYKVTERDMTRFIRAHANDVEFMSLVWREVSDSVQKRWDREIRLNRPDIPKGARPPGMGGPPDMDARPDSTLGPDTPPGGVVRPSGEPVPVPPPPRQGVQPAAHPPRRGIGPPVPSGTAAQPRAPSKPADRGPVTTPGQTVRPPSP